MDSIKDLAELGNAAAIEQFIRENAVDITHDGKTVTVFNATRYSIALGTPEQELLFLPPSGYGAMVKARHIEDTHGTSNWIETRWEPTSDAVYVALGSSIMLDMVVIGSKEAASAYPLRVKHVIPIVPMVMGIVTRMYWDRFGIVPHR